MRSFKIFICFLALSAVNLVAQEQENKSVTCMWIGCSASKAPAGESMGFKPEELCMQYNLANVYLDSDPSARSALQHAVDTEKVTQIIVCGTYGCPGIEAAMNNEQDDASWLKSVRNVYLENKLAVDALPNDTEKKKRVVELNVMQQVKNLSQSATVQNAWKNKQPVKITGVVHDREANKVKDLVCISSQEGSKDAS